jgi:uncharacterized protein HemX
MEGLTIASLLGILALAGGGIGVWVAMRERLVRAETKIEMLEHNHKDHKSEVQSLREWLEGQFSELRKGLDRKADK